MSKRNVKKRGLTDAELIAKYDTGGKVNFNKALKLMSKKPSQFALAKNAQTGRLKD